MRTLTLILLSLFAACGGHSTSSILDAPAPPPSCTGASCTCAAGTICDITASNCGTQESCSLACKDHNTCEGSCGKSCSIDCAGMSTCSPTVGDSGSVTCTGGSTCHVTCTGSCSLTCSPGSTCDLTCAGDTTAMAVTASGQCPH